MKNLHEKFDVSHYIIGKIWKVKKLRETGKLLAWKECNHQVQIQSSRRSLWYSLPILWYNLFPGKTKEQISWKELMPEMRLCFAFSLEHFCYKPETNIFYTFPLKNGSIHTTHLSAMCQTFSFHLQLPKKDLTDLGSKLSVSSFTAIPMQYIKCVDNFQPVLISKSL